MTPSLQRHCLDLLIRCPLIGMFSVADYVRQYLRAGDSIGNAHEDLLELFRAGVIELRPGDPLEKADESLLPPGPLGSKLVFARLIERELDTVDDVAPPTRPSRTSSAPPSEGSTPP